MSKKHLYIALLCNTIWGFSSIYWHMLGYMDAVFVLCSRIIFATVFSVILVGLTRKWHLFKETIKNRTTMMHLLPAAFMISFNWGVYIWAMGHERMLDASLGYFMAPLMVFAISVYGFGEKSGKMQVAAVFIALAGVLISVFSYGTVPFIGIVLGISFTLYGTIKKRVKVDPAVSICIESMILTPFALFAMAAFMRDTVVALSLTEVFLLMGTGIVTALPLILYASAVNNIPYITLGFTQYISPAITMLCGLFFGETFTPEKIVLLIFITISLTVFSIGTVQDSKKLKEEN